MESQNQSKRSSESYTSNKKKKGFKTPQGFGKAMKRLKSQLPESPSKKLATVKGLVKEMGLELNTESKAHKTGKNKGLSKE